MNLHLYKVWSVENSNPDDPCDSVRVMTEKDLRREFLWAYNHGRIPHELIDDYKADNDYKKENWNDMGNLRVGTMIDMLNDIYNYCPREGYYILETDVEVELNPKMIDGWLDVLNYWEDEIRDIAERFDSKYYMYEEYNKVIDDIYRIKKGV